MYKRQVPFYVGLIFSILASVIIGFFVGYATLRLRGDYFVITTFALGEIVKLVIENMVTVTGGARGMPDVKAGTTFIVVLILDIVVIFLLVNFLKSKYGRNCISIREEELAAKIIGINVMKYKMISFLISCALCGLAGGLLAHYMHSVSYTHLDVYKRQEYKIEIGFCLKDVLNVWIYCAG